MATKIKRPIIAVDEGSSRVKLAYINEDGKVSVQITPSVAQRDKLMTPDLNIHKGGYTIVGGETYTVTDNTDTPISNITAEKFQTSDVNLVAVHYALSQAGFGGQEVDIITSLPVGLFFNSSEADDLINREIIAKKKENLLRKVVPVSDEVKAATICDVKVCPEAVTAFSDLVHLDENGKEVEVDPYESFVVFDFGESTLDVTLIQGDGTVTNERFSSDLAVSRVIRKIVRSISKQEDIDISYSRGAHILRTGVFNGKSVAKHIEEAVAQVFADIELKIMDEIASLKKASRVYVIGGGAYLFGNQIKSLHKRVVVPKQPDITLALAMLNIGGAKPIEGRKIEE